MREKLTPSDLRIIRRLVHRCMNSLNVPGLAIGIVSGNKTLLAKGYGLADRKRGIPVTKDTLFLIGSCTKAFTATSLGILVDESILAFDEPIRRYLPSLKMSNPAVTKRLTVGDLLSHQSGLPNHFGAKPSRERFELLKMLAHLPLTGDFRRRFLYSNKGYILAGLVLEKLTGLAWEEFVRIRLFEPLNMRGSGFVSEITDAGQTELNGRIMATGYAKQGNRILPWYRGWSRKLSMASLLRAIGPDGTILSSAQDMCQWIALQFGAEGLKGRIISAKTLHRIHTPRVVTENIYSDWTEFQESSYAFGWRVQSYRGHKCVFHGGGGSGFTARVTFLPQDSLGIVVLSNLANSEIPEIMTWNLLDRLLGLPRIPWTARFSCRRRQRTAKRNCQANQTRISPVLPLGCYAGIYRHPGYGCLRVRIHRNKLKLHHIGRPYDRMEYTLSNRPKGVFQLIGPPGADISRANVQFHSYRQGQITSLRVPFEPFVGDILFRRIQRVN